MNTTMSDNFYERLAEARKTTTKSVDMSKDGPCPLDCPICADEKPPEHDMTASQHTGELPDGIMDLCPKCVDDDPMGWHFKADWHRWMLKEREALKK